MTGSRPKPHQLIHVHPVNTLTLPFTRPTPPAKSPDPAAERAERAGPVRPRPRPHLTRRLRSRVDDAFWSGVLTALSVTGLVAALLRAL